MRVLVSQSLAPFLEGVVVPSDVDVDRFSQSGPLPEGPHSGLLPLLTDRVGADELQRLPSLQVIANYGVGHENIDLEAAHARGIEVSNTPGVLTAATAELTWALILAATRRLTEGQRLARSGTWEGWAPRQLLGRSLEGKWLGIVGAGRIGREVGRRARAFGMKVVYWNRRPRPEWEQETSARRVDLQELLTTADVVSLHVALTPETKPLIDAGELALMKKEAILVNTSRGAVVDQRALIAVLAAGGIRAAGLDVYDGEPTIPPELRSLENVVLLPHLGSATREARGAMWDLAWRNLMLGIRGEPLLTPVSPE